MSHQRRHHLTTETTAPVLVVRRQDDDDDEGKHRRRKPPSFLNRRTTSYILLLGTCFVIAILIRKIMFVPSVRTLEAQAEEEHSTDKVNNNEQCTNVLLYLDDMFSANGIGCQLNNYILAVLVATFTNRKLVILSNSHFRGGSQFGCPSGNDDDDTKSFPNGLSRLLKMPTWLGCSNLPCAQQYDYAHYERIANSRGENDTTCTDEHNNIISILPLDAEGVRHIANNEFFFHKTANRTTAHYTDFYRRLGATSTEVEYLNNKGVIKWRKHELWDQVVSLLNRKKMITFQPWIVKDAQVRVKQVDLPQDYIAMHIRRGDKLKVESKEFVNAFWEKHGYNKTTQPANYIPFSHYLEQLDPNEDTTTIYVATDDPVTVKQEIANLSSSDVVRYNFIMNPDDASSTGHVQDGGQDCIKRYDKTVTAIADLLILYQANVFVGEYSSNWGRLLRTWRTTFDNNNTIGTGKPRDMKTTFGSWQPPGW